VNETPPADAGLSPESVEYETARNGVLVVGAGAAGARTAIELVEQGVDPDDVLVIESAATATPTRPGRAGIDGALGTLRSRATDLSSATDRAAPTSSR
jgi:succinate dehydrogenase / fumarate reductase flavoprotein subunit